MSSTRPGGGRDADELRRAKVAAQQKSRRLGPRDSDQVHNRARRKGTGTADHTGQLGLLAPLGVADQIEYAVVSARFEADSEAWLRTHRPADVTLEGEGPFVARARINGADYEGDGPTRQAALMALRHAIAYGPAPEVAPVPSAAAHAGAEPVSPAASLERAGRYFRGRQRQVREVEAKATGERDSAGRLRIDAAFTRIREADERHAAALGAPLPADGDVRSLLAHAAVSSVMQFAADEAYDFHQPAESREASTARTGDVERRRTDRHGPTR
jgi:hypothetical protein